VLLSLYGSGAKSVSELIRQERFRRLDVAEINTIGSAGSLHSFLAQLPRLAFSEYRGSDRLGGLIDGVRNEDMCRLTYVDESFDLVLSSDTLEHVPDFRAALRETRRVLRPGGRHIFTVPIVASRATTEIRAEIDGNGESVHLLPPLYHGRGAGLYRYIPVGADLLTFTEFGLDLTEHMRDAGFEAEVLRGGDDRDETGAAMVFSGRVPPG
jgi:SAM-dependent methyltransferase